jgi:photosystem II stability/assembly factor-like uncharacterized protein
MDRIRISHLLLIGALLLAGCAGQAAPVKTPAPTASKAETAEVPANQLASPTATQCTSTPPVQTYPPQPAASSPPQAYPPIVQPGGLGGVASTLTPAAPPTPTPGACTALVTAKIIPLDGTVNQFLLDYSFVDPQHGWVSTDSSLLATEDGGKTWQQRFAVPQVKQWEYDLTFYDIDFISTQEGFGLIHGSSLVHTLDGGRTWHPLPGLIGSFLVGQTPYPSDFVYQLDFVDPLHGWAFTRERGLVRTLDGGQTWLPIASPCISRDDLEQLTITFLDASTGWAACHLDGPPGQKVNALFSTQDGGDHWQKLAEAPADVTTGATPSAPSGWLPELTYSNSISFSDPSHGWLAASSGQLYITEDGGRSWTLETQSIQNPSFLRPQRFDSSTGLALAGAFVGGRSGPALLRTTDGGRTWEQILPKYYPDHVYYLDAHVGYGVDWMDAALGANRVSRTADGGRTWSAVGVLPDALYNPFQVQFVDAEHGWVTGQDCPDPANQQDCNQIALYRTVDGGQTWLRLWPRLGSEISIDSEFFVSAAEGYLMGSLKNSGRVLYDTHDGGQTVEPVQTVPQDGSLATYPYFYGLQYEFLNARVGYGINTRGFFITRDGAQTWQAIPAVCLSGSFQFTVIGAFSLGYDSSLWIMTRTSSNSQNYSASLISSIDGGKTWQAMILPQMVVSSFQFVDAQHGWLKGGTHTRYQGGNRFGADHIFVTDDGGHTWTQLN